MSRIKELGEKYKAYLELGNHQAAHYVRLQLNRLVMQPYKDRPRIYVGNDEYYSQEGAVNDGGRSWVLVPPRGKDE